MKHLAHGLECKLCVETVRCEIVNTQLVELDEEIVNVVFKVAEIKIAKKKNLLINL